MSRRRKCPLCGNNIRLRNDASYYKHTTGSQALGIVTAVTTKNKCSGSQLSYENACKIRDDRG